MYKYKEVTSVPLLFGDPHHIKCITIYTVQEISWKTCSFFKDLNHSNIIYKIICKQTHCKTFINSMSFKNGFHISGSLKTNVSEKNI